MAKNSLCSSTSSGSISTTATSSEEDEDTGELVINGRYRLLTLIGCGSFGEVFAAKDRITGEKVAVKLEEYNSKCPQLVSEHKVLKSLRGMVGIPNFRDFGPSADGKHLALVMDLLGISLEDQFNRCRRQFSLKTVLLLADDMISIVERLHSKRFLHRDIKPDNFVLELCTNKVNLVDFGLAKKYQAGKQHISKRMGKPLIGTARYTSINTHKGMEQRDDLEAVGYILIYFLKGKLPWQGLHAATRQQKEEKIMNIKVSTSTDLLCQGIPKEFGTFLNHVKGLTFEEKPEYSFLRQLFKILFNTKGFKQDAKYDWMK